MDTAPMEIGKSCGSRRGQAGKYSEGDRQANLPCPLLVCLGVALLVQASSGRALDSEKASEEFGQDSSYVRGQAVIKLKRSIGPIEGREGRKIKASQFPLGKDAPMLSQLFQANRVLAAAELEAVFKGKKVKAKPMSSAPPVARSGPESDSQDLGLDRVWKLEFDPEEDAARICRQIMATGEVEYCQPNYIMSVVGGY